MLAKVRLHRRILSRNLMQFLSRSELQLRKCLKLRALQKFHRVARQKSPACINGALETQVALSVALYEKQVYCLGIQNCYVKVQTVNCNVLSMAVRAKVLYMAGNNSGNMLTFV